MNQRTYNILVLCTGNSARSVMGEALLNVLGKGRFRAYSAGSRPSGKVQPMAAELAAKIGYDTANLRSKSWDEFSGPDAPEMDMVITVCGNADQACPVFPGQLNRHQWGFDDPAHATGTDEEKLVVFRKVRDEIKMVFEAYAAGRRDQVKAIQTT